MKNLAEELKNLEDVCDLAIISGDLADGSCIIEEDSFMPLSDVDMPIIFSPGNHDFYPGIDNVFNACNAAGIIVLDNEQIDFKDLSIFGFSYSFDSLLPVSEQTLRDAVKEDSVNLMIYHVPQKWEEFSDLGFNLQLSGHTHGGQFHPVTFLANILLSYNMGLFERIAGGKKAYLHVSTGVGVMDYPMRWGTDSELVILKLRKDN
jgi:predicted MPP superfamily phosphohydrolase